MAKKQKCPEFENHERWLVAFADMMTLLFALFVVLYSIANVNVEKLKKVSLSIQKAFGTPTDDPNAKSGGGGGTSKGNSRTEGIFNKLKGNTRRESYLTRNRRETAALISADMKKVESTLEDRLYGSKAVPDGKGDAAHSERVVYVTREADGIRVTLLARKLFKPNQTALDAEAKAALESVSEAVKGMGKVVRVEGHTDSNQFHMNGMTNWELSAMRACAVARYLVDETSFPKSLIYCAGFGDSHPVAANDTPENRTLNRRVDLKILYDSPIEEMHDDTKKERDDNQPEEDAPEPAHDTSPSE